MMRPKTIICDIDGTLILHNHGPTTMMKERPELIKGTLQKLEEWDSKSYKIILLTGRKESMRKMTEKTLQSIGIIYDKLIMGVGGGQRILINDLKTHKNSLENPTAVAINLERNKGISEIEI